MIEVALGQFPLPDGDDEWLELAVQLGCHGVILHVPGLPAERGYWEYDDLVALRERVEAWGLKLLSLENTQWPMYQDVMVGGPRRDEQIDNYLRTIANMGRAGIGVLGFCWMPSFANAGESMVACGRGGATVRVYDGGASATAPADRIPPEQMWDNFTRFITAVAPVAEDAGVRLALHPDDPPITAVDGIARIFTSLEAFQRATEEICPSPAFGLNFCMGTWSEMGPGVAMDAMRYFGERQRIVYVHFRDVKGHVPQFEECHLGEGNIDPVEALLLLREVGFDGFLEDDHVPVLQGDDMFRKKGHCFATGYIHGLLAAIEKLAPATRLTSS